MLRIRKRLNAEWKVLRGHNAAAVLPRLNPIIRGWAAYYRIGVSSEAFHALDTHMWRLAYKWAKRSHANKPRSWIIQRYFGPFAKSRQDQWVFGDRDSGAYLLKFSWTSIVRHQMVLGAASPDDATLANYWANRRRKRTPPLNQGTLAVLHKQHGRCPLCGDFLLHADREPQSPKEWEQWITATQRSITRQYIVAHGRNGTPGGFHLIHAGCQRRETSTDSAAQRSPRAHRGLPEPCAATSGTHGS